jgi:hypothetical protein
MVCEEAFLAHEGDIRNWAQQLGRQIEGDNLSFHAFLTLGKKTEIIRKRISNRSFYTRQYILYMFLDKIPQCIIKNNNGILSTDNYDDRPTSTRTGFKIKEIDYKETLSYVDVQDFIKAMK